MNDTFERKVRAAAGAGWWVVLVAIVFLAVQWFAYLAVMSAKPDWLLSLAGPGVDWPFLQKVWYWVIVGVKLFVWLLIFTMLWLTLWARRLRKLER
jgi:hypothetical protein